MFSKIWSSIEFLWSQIIAITNSKYEFLFYLALVFFIYIIYETSKRIRMRYFIAEKGFKNAQIFRFGISTLMAVSDDGIIGIVNEKFETMTINLKDIVATEIHISKFIISSANEDDAEKLAFSGIAKRLEPIMHEEKTKGIVLYVRLKDDKIFSVCLFKGTKFKTRPIEGNQKIILNMFKRLEYLEKKCKGKIQE